MNAHKNPTVAGRLLISVVLMAAGCSARREGTGSRELGSRARDAGHHRGDGATCRNSRGGDL